MRNKYHGVMNRTGMMLVLPLIPTMSANAQNGIVAVTDDVVVYTQIPLGIQNGAWSDNREVRVWSERRSVLAAAIMFNHVNPGRVTSDTQLVEGPINAGTPFHSYMIRFDPGGNNGVTRGGSVTFDAEILGVIVGRGRLNDSDEALKRPGVTYNMNINRGMELSDSEYFEISADRRRIDFSMTVTNGPTDDIRVVLASTCPADFNANGAVNSADFFDFVSAFFEGTESADVNGDASVNSQDFFDFLNSLFAGC